MIRTSIPNTDLRVSPICLGTGDFGGGMDVESSFALLDAFVEQGGNFLDTAHIYNDWIPGEKSRSEKVIGAWMKERRNREQVVISTKGAHPFLSSMQVGRLSPAEIISDLDESLAFLQVDQIDLYWLHRDDPARPVAEILDTLNSQVKAGKIRYFGASNWRTARLREAQEYAINAGLQAFAADQVLYNAAVIDANAIPDQTIMVMDADLHAYHCSSGLATLAFTSQANGLFQHIQKGDFPGLLSPYPLQPNLERYERLCQVAKESSLSLTQAVLGVLLAQPFPVIPIIGPKRIEQLTDSMSASAVSLSRAQLEYIQKQ